MPAKPAVVNASALKKVYAKREPWIHKGQRGYLLAVAGSELYTGSPTFNALSALRAGCDLVRVLAPRRAADAVSHRAPDLIAFPLEGTRLTPVHVPLVLEQAQQHHALVIGCGLGRADETRRAVLDVLHACSLPTVIDADAIRAVAHARQPLRNPNSVLTPHANEFQALTGTVVSNKLDERIEAVQEAARQYACVVVLKGSVDVIADGRKKGKNAAVALNKTGSPFMTKGGFGDSLAGICGAFLARGLDAFTAAQAACFLNGKAGELAAKEKGEGVLASDLIDALPRALR